MNLKAKEKEKHCEECGKPLFGRTDKRFCNDTCRNTFNREKAAREAVKAHENLPEIFRAIKNNYEILQTYGLHKLRKDEFRYTATKELLDQGFHFKFFTSQYIDSKGTRYNCCFELGWEENPQENCFLGWFPRQAIL